METCDERRLRCLLAHVRGADEAAMEAARRRWDGIAKPVDGLGKFERLFVKLAGAQGSAEVKTARRAVVVFCADNGVVAEGVSQTDSSVTAAVTDSLARGTGNVCRMAAAADADVFPVDMGVLGELHEPGVRDCKIAPGTGNIAVEAAMTQEQALAAIHTGIALAAELKDMGYDLAAAGEMGIGNTTTGSAVAAALLGLPAEAVTGRGAGLSAEGLRRKTETVRRALALHRPDPKRPAEVLAALGGFDIAGMCGFYLGAAVYRLPVVLDGMISLAAALLAQAFCPAVTDYLLPSHVGKEPVCGLALKKLGLSPVICGDLALGEGTGAVMLFPLLDLAGALYGSGTTFDRLNMKAYERYGE